MNSNFRYRTAPLLYEDTIKTFFGSRDFGLALGAMSATFEALTVIMAK